MSFADPEPLSPEIHCFARCYRCKNLVRIQENENGLSFEERPCPRCGVELSEATLRESFVEQFLNTAAITSANKFISLDLAVVPFSDHLGE
jgi:methylphosphotriester-DNA--protein-cysteine methyltransferase